MTTVFRLLVVPAVVLFAALDAPAAAQTIGQKASDLRERVIAVRSIDPTDEDFSDLTGLAAAIGNARIVQLGESSHGDGAAFAAKVRLVKFLHRELGFDVLLWESGTYDLSVVDDSLRAGADPARSARLGIFGIWSAAREVLPLFDYARASHASARPLLLAGLDPQFSARQPADLENDLLRFIAASASDVVRDTATQLTRAALAAFRRVDVPATRPDSMAPTPADLERFTRATEALLALFRTQRSEFAGDTGQRDVAFMERVILNLRDQGTTRYERGFAGRPADSVAISAAQNSGWNRRDLRMAENLRWFAETRFPDRKLIVWAHNGHIMNAYYHADWSALSHQPMPGGMKPMGAFAAERFGDAVYTIGFTAYTGEHGFSGMPNSEQIVPKPEDSVEALLHALGHEQAFLDFRALPRQHWLRQRANLSIRGHMPEVMDNWTRVVDGIFFIERMTRATPAR